MKDLQWNVHEDTIIIISKNMVCKIVASMYDVERYLYKGQVTKVRLSCYMVLLSVDSKTR